MGRNNYSPRTQDVQWYKKLPSRIQYIIVGIIAVVFVLFWLVGFNKPYDEDPNFNAPLFTDVLLVLMILIVLGGIGIAVWSVVWHLKIRGRADSSENNIPVKKIAYIVAGGTFALLLLTFLVGSSAPMRINGNVYNDAFWLKVSDMFIMTSILLIIVAIAAVVYGGTKYIRKS